MVHDTAGTPYFLFWTVVQYGGQRHLEQLPPEVAAQIKPGQHLFACLFALTNYQTSVCRAEIPIVFVMNDEEAWDRQASALRPHDGEHTCAWSYNGERMDLHVRSETLAFNLEMQGGSQVMWAKDRLGAEGLIQEGAEGSGARVNLYNFSNGYQVATYQKADGTLQWFDHFLVKQNGYAKSPAG